MSDQDLGKKMVEEFSLELFLEQYQKATGVEIAGCARSEAPDFECEDGDGNPVGIELTQVVLTPEDRTWAEIHGRQGMSADDALAYIHGQLVAKSLSYTRRSMKMIVVLDLHDISIQDMLYALENIEYQDFADLNFDEIWLSDRSSEPFPDVELYCLHPPQLRGYYPREPQKPYG